MHLDGPITTSTLKFVVYFSRWIILVVFFYGILTNAMLWVTFAPISDTTQTYFHGGYYGTKTSVNMLANVFLILYLPGTVLSVFTCKYLGVKNSLVIACVLTCLGAFIRWVASYWRDQLQTGPAYTLMLLVSASFLPLTRTRTQALMRNSTTASFSRRGNALQGSVSQCT